MSKDGTESREVAFHTKRTAEANTFMQVVPGVVKEHQREGGE